jgi:hypothetical protein
MGFVYSRVTVAQKTIEKLSYYVFKRTCYIILVLRGCLQLTSLVVQVCAHRLHTPKTRKLMYNRSI